MPSASSHGASMFINRGNSPQYGVINPVFKLFLYQENRFAAYVVEISG